MRKLLSISCMVSALALTGCASIGGNFDLNCADNLTPGVSTKADAILACGSSTHEHVYENGMTDMSWTCERIIPFASVDKRLTLIFDKDEKFQSIIGKSKLQ